MIELTREQTIKALECCANGSCEGCTLIEGGKREVGSCINILLKDALHYLKENEPAPSANDTSSTYSHDNDNIEILACQVDESVLTRILDLENKLEKLIDEANNV